MACIM